ncbi:MAG: response regulator transcription factor [Clostridiales bacterium]|jgi:DNA-binding response OmpR family regulator|nr:response regulator transcription factor [Clostridiales bacterium]
MKRILIIEDDKQIAEFEKDYLEASQYEVDVCATGDSGLRKAEEADYSLIILDISMPNMDGFEVCRQLAKKRDIPIIFVSAKSDSLDKLKGFGLGAADYVVKPFEPSELVARVNTHIKRYDLLTNSKEASANEILSGDLRIEKQSRRVFLKDSEVSLANKEFDLLLFMAENPNIVFSKNKLLDEVWGIDAYVDLSTVAVHINRIREKIEENSSKPKFVETVWGAGYRFNKR